MCGAGSGIVGHKAGMGLACIISCLKVQALSCCCQCQIVSWRPFCTTISGYVLTSCNTNLKEQVAELCELWWCNGIEGKESLVSAPIIYLLEKCLLSKPKVKVLVEHHPSSRPFSLFYAIILFIYIYVPRFTYLSYHKHWKIVI